MKIDLLVVGMVHTNSYIAYDEVSREAVIFDPGDDAKRILRRVNELDLCVKYVILTHAHFDHLLAAKEVCAQSGAYLAVSSKARLDDAGYQGFTSFGFPGFEPICADVLLNDGDVLSVAGKELKFLETPGHTPCSMCVLCEDVLFAGDTLFAGSCGRCDLPGGNYGTMMNSLKFLSTLDGKLRVLPGHGAETTIERERQTNPYMREAMR